MRYHDIDKSSLRHEQILIMLIQQKINQMNIGDILTSRIAWLVKVLSLVDGVVLPNKG